MGMFTPSKETARTRTRGAVNLVAGELSNVSEVFTSSSRRLEALVAVCGERIDDLDIQIAELQADRDRIQDTAVRSSTILENINGILGVDAQELEKLSMAGS